MTPKQEQEIERKVAEYRARLCFKIIEKEDREARRKRAKGNKVPPAIKPLDDRVIP